MLRKPFITLMKLNQPRNYFAFSMKVRFTVYPEGFKDTKKIDIEAIEGENLMEVILENKTWGTDLEEFGLCGKELSCHTCRVNFVKGYEKLVPPAEEEEDVFESMDKSLFKDNETRMSC